MFLNPVWSILLLCAPVAVYWFIIRPRLEARFTDLYAHIDSFWGRVWARTYAFRSFWVATFGAILTALPDILVHLAPIDFSPILPQPWPGYVSTGVAVILVLIRAFDTRPCEDR